MQIRVYYEDTDCGGIVYHANYLKYCERARSEMFFKRKIAPLQDGIGFVVKSMQLDFLAPARLGDILEIKTQVLEQKFTSVALQQTIWRPAGKEAERTKIFQANLVLVCVDSATQKIVRIPQWAQDVLAEQKEE